jgi:hypothetical protein
MIDAYEDEAYVFATLDELLGDNEEEPLDGERAEIDDRA